MSVYPGKVIAVSQRVDVIKDRDEVRDALDQKFCALIIASGFLPVPVPNVLANSSCVREWLSAVKPSGFILSGGNDIGDIQTRDSTETELLNYAEENIVPVLGICRGMQMLGTHAGMELMPVKNHVRIVHGLLLAENFYYPEKVNSFHNSGFMNCPAGYFAAAQTEDGVIEAIRHEALPWEGWMWHPERTSDFDVLDIKNIQNLFKKDQYK